MLAAHDIWAERWCRHHDACQHGCAVRDVLRLQELLLPRVIERMIACNGDAEEEQRGGMVESMVRAPSSVHIRQARGACFRA